MERLYREHLAEQLAVREELISDMMPKMIIDTDYYNLPNKNGFGSKYSFTIAGVNKAKEYIKQLDKERVRVLRIADRIGYRITQRSYPSIWIYFGICLHLKDKGYKDSSIAYIMKKHRTTIVTIWDRMQQYQNDKVASAIIYLTVKELEDS